METVRRHSVFPISAAVLRFTRAREAACPTGEWDNVGGAETVTLNTTQVPAHNHQIFVVDEDGDSESPVDKALAVALLSGRRDNQYTDLPDSPEDTLDARAVSSVGGSREHENMQPFLTINYCIALTGVFPSRN